MAVTRQSIRTELRTLFPTILNDAHYDLFVEIGHFLGNHLDGALRNRLLGAFADLEEDIQETKSDRRWMVQKCFGPAAPTGWEKDKDSHLLTATLSRFEREQGGFNTIPKPKDKAGSEERARLYLSFVRPDLFRTQLVRGFHWKDPTVSAEHGEFTHRMQWYALVSAGVVSKADARTVMARCGQYVCKPPPANPKGRTVPETDLWETLFDRDTKDNPNTFLYPYADSDNDFRNPNNLNSYLRGADELRFLSSFLSARYKKRSDDFSIALNYPMKKKFGKDKKLRELTLEQKTTLYGIVLDGTDGAVEADYLQKIAENVYADYSEENAAEKIELVRQALAAGHPEPYV